LHVLRTWAKDLSEKRKDVLRIGYFGSLASGTWGVGSDLDLVVIVDSATEPFERRGKAFDALSLPVPVDLLVYTMDEWRRMTEKRKTPRGVVWLVPEGL
jgi:predicted nucleotidyltransferase